MTSVSADGVDRCFLVITFDKLIDRRNHDVDGVTQIDDAPIFRRGGGDHAPVARDVDLTQHIKRQWFLGAIYYEVEF
ncbi:MAG: hypothetical protein VYA50_04955, partial [Chloroflexota bacterium]|nr:hypothetical protein [Chloroflexota bacterium]